VNSRLLLSSFPSLALFHHGDLGTVWRRKALSSSYLTPPRGDSFFPGGEIRALRSRCHLTEFERKKLAETESQCRLNLDDYFLALELFTAFLPAVFLRGRPSFGLATNASTSARNTSVLPATVILDSLPRLMRSAMACFDTSRIRAASA
jgi:hypothetical protein